ncbi:hypothetical protein [Moorena producens]|uniref:hypothetical protein n=1 Tax=Moorena producens TaxID=1155739 RepID=UPI003C71FBF0
MIKHLFYKALKRNIEEFPTKFIGKHLPVSGQLSVVSGQWSVVSGQWSVVSGQPLAYGLWLIADH